MHSFHLLLKNPIPIISREQVMFLVTVFGVEVLEARIWHLELGALVLVVQSIALPALGFTLDYAVFLQTAPLNKCQPLAIRIAYTLQPWWGFVVGQHFFVLTIIFWKLSLAPFVMSLDRSSLSWW